MPKPMPIDHFRNSTAGQGRTGEPPETGQGLPP